MSRTGPTATFALLLAGVAAGGAMCARVPPPELPPLPTGPAGEAVSYREQVQPVLENRCVVCHGCYDAPCQLLLSSYSGVSRGASKDAIYHSARLAPAEPTRLFMDAQSTEQWRQRGFHPVLGAEGSAASGGLLLPMLAFGRANPFAPGERLPDSLPLDNSRELACPTEGEFGAYAKQQPLGGMPYGMAPLSDAELGTLAAWVRQGAAPPSPPPALPQRASAQVERWEAFLNGESLKERITARYLYEHWFLAHLTLEELPTGPFFEIVRSRTPPGAAVEVIATRRPYDDPGSERFWYRLRPLEETIVHKTHIVYRLSGARMQRLSELFLESDWQPTRLPGYGAREASNPFVSFDQIPARSRYQFLLDDAAYFVRTFIRGPVCRGQVAVDVIEDRFFAVFLDPDRDLSVVDPSYLERTKEFLRLPGEHASHLAPGGIWLEYDVEQRRYLDAREKAYDAADPDRLGPTLDFIWDGDGHNRSALLTIFRNFDNATVVRGFVGGIPETAWVIDFPLFERIYYDLVADFDVFGNATHQLSTRLYMDHLRMQSENLFLAFLPADRREEIRASWYEGATAEIGYHTDSIHSARHGTQIRFSSPDVKAELLEMILARDPAVSGPPDRINRCAEPPCDRPDASPLERRAERALQKLAGVRGPWVAELPEVTLLRVRSGAGEEGDAVYALAHDKAHTNVAAMFAEAKRRQPEKDELTIVRGTLGSYPNFLFEVDVSEVEAFVQALAAVKDAAAFEALVERFGVRRTSPRFWEAFDWIHADFRRRQPTQAGLLDLNRYENL
jgi:hypothetical protein